VSSEFPGKWKTSVVLPILKVSSPVKFSDYRLISINCLYVEGFCGVDGSVNGETYSLQQLAGFRLDFFRQHHSTAAAVLKVTEDIRLSMEYG
jgi:hypothetical protein